MAIPLKLVHIPCFRSTRVVWLYHELASLYATENAEAKGSTTLTLPLPPLEISTFADIPSFRSNKPDWLLAVNPNGKVPSLSHGSINLFEGGAICSYLLDQYDVDRKLLPRNPEAVAKYYMYSYWCASTLDNLTATSSPIQRVIDVTDTNRPMDDIKQNKKYFAEIAAPQITKDLTQSEGPFLCGKEFTAVDVIVGYWLRGVCVKMEPQWVTMEEWPALYVYFQNVSARPGYLAAIAPVPISIT